LRLLLFAVVYQLAHELRRQAAGELRIAQLDTFRLLLLRIPALVQETARCLWMKLSAFYPGREQWQAAARAFGAGNELKAPNPR
jgi:hypothetical protein